MIAESSVSSSSGALGVATLLRDTRLKLGRDLAVVATTLRIRQPYLQAIEEGRYHDLPGATYAVGFVRGYADYLGLDGNEIVRRFKQENSELSGRAELVFPSSGSGSGIPTGALLALAVIGAAAAYGIWYWLQDRPESLAEAVPALPERLAALIHKPAPEAAEPAPAAVAPAPVPAPTVLADTVAPAADQPSPTPIRESEPVAPPPAVSPATAPPVDSVKPAETKAAKLAKLRAIEQARRPTEGDNPTAILSTTEGLAPAPEPLKVTPSKQVWHASKRVALRADADCWIKIRDADGQMVLSRLLHKGDVFAPPDKPGLVMTIGSAGALTVLVDGKETPSLGAAGTVRRVGLDPEQLDGSAPKEALPPVSHGENE